MPNNEPEDDAGKRALQKKISQGRPFAKEMAEALNYNVSHNVDDDRRILPERPKTFEDAFLSRLRQADAQEATE